MKKIIAIAALSVAMPTSAFAAGNNSYLTADLSSAFYSNATFNNGAGTVFTFPNPGKFGIGAGYQFMPNVAAEVGYHMFGDSTITDRFGSLIRLQASSLTVSAVGSYTINNQFSAIGKLGFAMNKAVATSNFGFTQNDNKTSLYVALGGQFNINQQFGVRMQYENFGNFQSGVNPMSASAFGIAGVINF